MVEDKRPKFAVIPGGLSEAGKGMISPARQAHRDFASKCILDIHGIIDRMAGRTANPELFKERMKRHFNMPTTPDDRERRGQMEGALTKMLAFEDAFNAHLGANGYPPGKPLPKEKIVSTVEHIAQSAWSGFRRISEGWKRPPPDSA
ncbi:MAG: hypothetical protein PHQ80_03505 [Candidatus ainarchaeum sp.]|nr:hypothetical protein [Candidatus ainarchaeum sp.]MDD5096377.1 hypothetical protein [Candidatus ainarchaeum sp.]